MHPEEAVAILKDVFSPPIENTRTAPHLVRLAVGAPTPDGKATLTLTIFLDGQLWDAKEQDVPVLPEVGWEQIAAPAYRVFALGIRLAVMACDLATILPHKLMLVNLLRIQILRSAEEVADAILNSSARKRALATLEVGDYGRAHALPPLPDASIHAHLWVLMGDAQIEEAEEAARSLRDSDRTEAIPYVLCLLEDWQERMWHTGGLSWVSDDNRNVDVLLARILGPLLRKGCSPSERKRLDTLEVTGLFEKENETRMYEWMYRT